MHLQPRIISQFYELYIKQNIYCMTVKGISIRVEYLMHNLLIKEAK